MRKILLYSIFLIYCITYAQSPSGCDSTDWPDTVYQSGNGVAFSVPEGSGEGWTYKWIVTSPNLDIVSGQGTPTAYIKGNMGHDSGTVYVVKCKDFESACSDMKTVTIETNWEPTPTPIPLLTCIGYESVVPEDITLEGKLNVCTASSLTNLADTTLNLTFTWSIKFDDGTLLVLNGLNPVFREKCLENPVRSIGLEISNGILSKKFYAGVLIGIHHIPGFGILDLLTSCVTGESCDDSNGLLFRNIQIFPNPTTSTIRFSGDNLDDYSIVIFDSNGEKIMEKPTISKEINLKNQQKGLYFYVVRDREGNEKTGKIIRN
ncbi:T9SS type A sorting domain-containing protein [Kordia algicida OT-1]|uniref:Secretion system C-terminal sorting domain-containing protein n=1 Tax=Kordia algicida OT-1 TaxID=391587 RepID=A9DWT1_9FLAO|nr:T9SS type A sorting domain-containing protein [Kordia algicida]EDP95929.1 hypothetical protein KAOT1_07168 [Kordia algicida OT-1]